MSFMQVATTIIEQTWSLEGKRGGEGLDKGEGEGMGEGGWAPSESIGTSTTDGGEAGGAWVLEEEVRMASRQQELPLEQEGEWSWEITGSMECGRGDHIDVHPGVVQDQMVITNGH